MAICKQKKGGSVAVKVPLVCTISEEDVSCCDLAALLVQTKRERAQSE